jgi:heme A synthase
LPVFLRIASVLALLRSVGLYFFKATVLGSLAGSPLCIALANGLAVANLGLAFLFWRAGANPAAERSGMYTALLVTGLRGVSGTYEVLYLLEGNAAAVSLIDMVACIALFVGILNALPGTLREAGAGAQNSEARIQNDG